MPFGIQPWHLIVVLVVALIIFGPSRLPQLGRSMGKFFRDLKAGARDMGAGLKEGMQEPEGSKPTVTAASPAAASAASASNSAAEKTAEGNHTGEKGNFCTACGAPNPPEARFCNACGKPVKG